MKIIYKQAMRTNAAVSTMRNNTRLPNTLLFSQPLLRHKNSNNRASNGDKAILTKTKLRSCSKAEATGKMENKNAPHKKPNTRLLNRNASTNHRVKIALPRLINTAGVKIAGDNFG